MRPIKLAKLLWAAPCSAVGLVLAAIPLTLGGRAKWSAGALEVTYRERSERLRRAPLGLASTGRVAVKLSGHQKFSRMPAPYAGRVLVGQRLAVLAGAAAPGCRAAAARSRAAASRRVGSAQALLGHPAALAGILSLALMTDLLQLLQQWVDKRQTPSRRSIVVVQCARSCLATFVTRPSGSS